MLESQIEGFRGKRVVGIVITPFATDKTIPFATVVKFDDGSALSMTCYEIRGHDVNSKFIFGFPL